MTLQLGLARDPVTDTSNNLGTAGSYGPIGHTAHVLKTDTTIETSLFFAPVKNQYLLSHIINDLEQHFQIRMVCAISKSVYHVHAYLLEIGGTLDLGTVYLSPNCVHVSDQSIQNTCHFLLPKSN